MLKKLYAKYHISQRHSLINFEDQQGLQNKKNRAKSHVCYSNQTKTSERSAIRSKKLFKRIDTVPNEPKHYFKVNKSQPKLRQSNMPLKNTLQKTKASISKHRKNNGFKTKPSTNTSLSGSYESLLKQFECDQLFKKSLKKLVKLEKISLKKKFSCKNKFFSNYIGNSCCSNKTNTS
jgi:hypothetical protein